MPLQHEEFQMFEAKKVGPVDIESLVASFSEERRFTSEMEVIDDYI
jgi:hypothetical protein